MDMRASDANGRRVDTNKQPAELASTLYTHIYTQPSLFQSTQKGRSQLAAIQTGCLSVVQVLSIVKLIIVVFSFVL